MDILTVDMETYYDKDFSLSKMQTDAYVLDKRFEVIGQDYGDVVAAGLEALRTVGRRGADTGKFIMNASEIRALNDVMELHDAQMDVIVLKDMERAIELVNKEYQLRRMTPIVENT